MKIKFIIIFLLILPLLISKSNYSKEFLIPWIYNLKKLEIKKIKKINTKKLEISNNSINSFLKELSFKESSGNWKSINEYGYIGLYQFGKIALIDIDYTHIDVIKFKENPDIFPVSEQNKAIIKLLKKNSHYLRKYIKYHGEIINGVKITISGMLASSHLIGVKSTKKFLKSNGKIDISDNNGIKCSDYMKHFSDYNLYILLL